MSTITFSSESRHSSASGWGGRGEVGVGGIGARRISSRLTDPLFV